MIRSVPLLGRIVLFCHVWKVAMVNSFIGTLSKHWCESLQVEL